MTVMIESKISATHRLQRAGLWNAASLYRDRERLRLRAEGNTRADAREGAWQLMSERFQPRDETAFHTTLAMQLCPPKLAAGKDQWAFTTVWQATWVVISLVAEFDHELRKALGIEDITGDHLSSCRKLCLKEGLKKAACFEMNWLLNKIPSHYERHATMIEINDSAVNDPTPETPRDTLTEILRAGAQKMLAAAIEREVVSYVEKREELTDDAGRRLVVRNGFLPEREILTGIGKVAVKQPRVRDRRPPEQREYFTPAVLPKYLRKTKSMEELIPWLYLKGISTNDFPEALQALLGADAKGLSASTITRLKSVWEDEYANWSKRSLAGKRYVYLWADGIYCNVRLEDNRQCLLVLMGATADGTKELIAVVDGVRESELSWKEVLLSLKSRGLEHAPELAIGDGSLGFWKALREVFPETREQRCTVHKTANVLNKLPKSIQPQAKRVLHDIWQAPTRAEADKAFDLFLDTFEAKYPRATTCLEKDRTELLAFYDFPAENWCHIRTTNPIESTFATIRLRQRKTRGCGSAKASLTMMFKLAQSAAKGWRKLRGHTHLKDLLRGVRFIDGENEHTLKEKKLQRSSETTSQKETAA